MKDLQKKAEELAESYINGNISYVREKIKHNGKLAIAVYGILQETQNQDELNLFHNRMVTA